MRGPHHHLEVHIMKCLNLAPVFLAAAIGSTSSAFAGVSDVVSTTVERLTLDENVTYSTAGTKGLTSKVGYVVKITRSGTNVVNNLVFEGTTSITAIVAPPVGVTPSGPAVFLEANGDGGVCRAAVDNSSKVVCNFGQMRPNDAPKEFALFFRAPIDTPTNCFTDSNAAPCEAVRFEGATNYSEGTGDNSGSASNDQSSWNVPDVRLGTNDPKIVRSALSKSGGELFTGTDGVPSPATFKFAAKLNAPQLPNYTTATLDLKDVTDNNAASSCLALGNFKSCLEAGVLVPGVYLAPNPDEPALTKFLTIILRIDSNEVNSPFRRANIQVININDLHDEETVQPCNSFGLPPSGLDRCVFDIRRIPNAGSNGELRGDVEVVIRAYRNAPYRIR
jgi:hypothetical protein